ncbi:cysteine dioxygenase family protein [Flavobacterium sp. CS20]|jgi:hypothetical protein|uniref:cysteine dioxygenase n=1 Tax=Flavobacterium sp. CS20 TaxID=2775246 RepID=UPI001B3A7992|nr:cysteine dioxygenase family protein [Flavobacterium sp. CS20]QTY26981.1 cysteine dioxygenase family protein [Flavobacterium sp. CS20]
MHNLIKKLVHLNEKDVNKSSLVKILESEDIDVSRYKIDANQTTRGYHRIPILNDFVVAYLMIWPASVSSSIHQHKNIKGVIKVLDGKIEEHEYKFDDNQKLLERKSVKTYRENDIIYENKDAIHQVFNTSKTQTVCTMHIYYPPSQNLNGSVLFDPNKGIIATLSDLAFSYSWNQPKEAFSKIDSTGFIYKT